MTKVPASEKPIGPSAGIGVPVPGELSVLDGAEVAVLCCVPEDVCPGFFWLNQPLARAATRTPRTAMATISTATRTARRGLPPRCGFPPPGGAGLCRPG